MPDRGKFWPAVPDWSSAGIHQPRLGIGVARAQAIWLVSGDLAKFQAQHGVDCIGPRDTISGARYALRLAPDRLLFVGNAGAQATAGWSDGVAITDVSDGFLLFDVTGPAALEVVAMGADYDFTSRPALPMESAAMLFAGLKVSVVRIAGGWRLHVERPYAAALWHWLEYATQDHARAAAPAGVSSSR
jgi:heterotetrameric sarcosine oxidase gamma subunit